MAHDAGLFRWRERSLAVRIAFIVVTSAVFLYAGVAENPLAMRAFNLEIAALVFAWGGWVLHQSGVGIALRTAAAACLLVSGVLLAYSSIVGPIEGMFVFGDNEALLTDVGTLFRIVGGGLAYFLRR